MIRTDQDGIIPGCDRIQPVILNSIDVTSEINSYFRDVTVSDITGIYHDVTQEMVEESAEVTVNTLCEPLTLPAMNPWGVIMCFTGLFWALKRSMCRN